MILSNCKPGVYKVKALACGHYLSQKLLSIGIYEGSEIELISHDNHCPIRVLAKNVIYSLGEGICDKIIVGEIDG